jgi:hypothetical protein
VAHWRVPEKLVSFVHPFVILGSVLERELWEKLMGQLDAECRYSVVNRDILA